MKTLTLSVKIQFSESIEKDKDIQEVMEKVISALVHEVNNGMGLAPDDSEAFTKIIKISEPYSQTSTTHDFLTEIEYRDDNE
jgi:hypothetical protein